MTFERLNNLHLTLIQRLFARLLDIERDQHFVVGGLSITLHAGIFQSGAFDLIVDRGRIGRMRILDVNQRAASEVNAERNTMPECHGKHSRHAEDKREGQEVPLFPEEIEVVVAKKFQVQTPSFRLRAAGFELALFRGSGLVARSLIFQLKYSALRPAASGSAPNRRSCATQT